MSALATYLHETQTVSPEDKAAMKRVVLNYLVHEGYQETVRKYCQEIGLSMEDPENVELIIGMNSMKERQEVKFMLLRGEIADAIDRLNLLYPDLLEQNNFLYFKLLLLSLIEMIRNHQPQEGVDKEEFVMKVIKFAQDKLTNKAIKNVKFMGELELTMTLLLYSNNKEMLPPKLNELFEVKLRRDIADLVNKCILLKELETLVDVNYKKKFPSAKHDAKAAEDTMEDEVHYMQLVDSKLKKMMKLWCWLENKVHGDYDIEIPLFKFDEDTKPTIKTSK